MRRADAERSPGSRARLLGGLLGPTVFICGWAGLGMRTEGYSPVDDTISELAALGAPTRPAMTGAFIGYAAGMALYGTAVGRRLGRPVALAATINAAATVGVAVTPLESSLGGVPHAIAAGTGYVTLAALPLLAASHLRRTGTSEGRALSLLCGLGAAASLTASVVVDSDPGAWQRLGLTIGDLWVMASAAALLVRDPHGPVR